MSDEVRFRSSGPLLLRLRRRPMSDVRSLLAGPGCSFLNLSRSAQSASMLVNIRSSSASEAAVGMSAR